MKFAMGADVLAVLTKLTSGSSQDLGTLVIKLLEAAEPLEGRFQGAGRGAFDRFKERADGISVELDASLHAVLAGVSGMDRVFNEGESDIVETTKGIEASAGFDAARFGTRGSVA